MVYLAEQVQRRHARSSQRVQVFYYFFELLQKPDGRELHQVVEHSPPIFIWNLRFHIEVRSYGLEESNQSNEASLMLSQLLECFNAEILEQMGTLERHVFKLLLVIRNYSPDKILYKIQQRFVIICSSECF